jgi:uncharacterized protein YgfB (UPF0149 family)
MWIYILWAATLLVTVYLTSKDRKRHKEHINRMIEDVMKHADMNKKASSENYEDLKSQFSNIVNMLGDEKKNG